MMLATPTAFMLDWKDGDDVKIYNKLERIGRVAYKSEDRISKGSAERFIKMLLDLGHESVLEHVSISCKFICDRGISHELVRHRIASYTQESTRYCNYHGEKFGGAIAAIYPSSMPIEHFKLWCEAVDKAEEVYMKLINEGVSPQLARSVLPNALKTEVVMTANLREWRHFFKLRCSPKAHPQMRELACELLSEFKAKLPIIFGDLTGYEDGMSLNIKEE